MIDHIWVPDHILRDIHITHMESLKAFLENNLYDLSSIIISFGFLPEEVDKGTSTELYV